MLAFKGGDERAFDELVARNTPKVHGLVFRFLGNAEEVEDLTQEVFVRVYRTAKRYEPSAKFSTWLYRVTANLCFNVMRSRKKVHTWQLDYSDGDDDHAHRDVEDHHAASPSDRLDAGELGQVVAQAVAKLPETQRMAIILNKYEDKSYEEIAAIMEISTMAVKSLLSRARGNLKDTLERYLKHGTRGAP